MKNKMDKSKTLLNKEFNKKNIEIENLESDKETRSQAEILLYELSSSLDYDTSQFYCDKEFSIDVQETWLNDTNTYTIQRKLLDSKIISDNDFNELLRQYRVIVNNMVVDYALKNVTIDKELFDDNQLSEFKKKHSPHDVVLLTDKEYKTISEKKVILLCKHNILIQLFGSEYFIKNGIITMYINILVEKTFCKQYDGIKILNLDK